MLLRKTIFAIAAVATIATSTLAATSASAFADGSVRFAHSHGGRMHSPVPFLRKAGGTA
jgi:hypothetical protein